MKFLQLVSLLLAIGLAPAAAVAETCTDCYAEGIAAHQGGEPERALSLFQQGCTQDHGPSCTAAAKMFASGEGTPRDSAQALSLGVRGCDLGHMQGCRDLGVGIIRSQDPELAAQGRELLARSCEGGIASGCGALGQAVLRGYGGPVDRATGLQLMARACELGYALGCTTYGASFLSGDDQAKVLARVLVKQGCDGGDPKGCGYFGVALRDGVGGHVDEAAAIGYLEQACAGGFPPFCSDLAAALVKGTGGVEQDIERAATLFEDACNGGWEKACENAEVLAQARQKQAPKERSGGWSMSGENLSFSTRKDPDEPDGWEAASNIGSMQIGQGTETATFSDVRASCGMLRLMQAFGSAAAEVRQCLGESDSRRVTLVIEDGSITSSSVEPDDAVGQCVTNALGRGNLTGLTCEIEATVSR